MYAAATPSSRLPERIRQPLKAASYLLSIIERRKYLKDNKEKQNKSENIELSEEDKIAFVKAMKIGYYKEFHKQGLITDQQLEMLIAMQDRTDISQTA